MKLYYPPNFDREGKYPVLVHVYGGPGYQMVNYAFDLYDYQGYLPSNYPVIYAIIDPKGSGYQGIHLFTFLVTSVRMLRAGSIYAHVLFLLGNDWRFEMYRKFGQAEVDSTLEVAQRIQSLPFVDSKNMVSQYNIA